jgi:hypothetical protein
VTDLSSLFADSKAHPLGNLAFGSNSGRRDVIGRFKTHIDDGRVNIGSLLPLQDVPGPLCAADTLIYVSH